MGKARDWNRAKRTKSAEGDLVLLQRPDETLYSYSTQRKHERLEAAADAILAQHEG